MKERIRKLLADADAWDLLARAARQEQRPKEAAMYAARALDARTEAGKLIATNKP